MVVVERDSSSATTTLIAIVILLIIGLALYFGFRGNRGGSDGGTNINVTMPAGDTSGGTGGVGGDTTQ